MRSLEKTDLRQSLLDVLLSVVHVKTEDLASIDNQRDDRCRNQDSNEQRRDGVEPSPAIELDQQCRYNNAHGTKGILHNEGVSIAQDFLCGTKHTAITCRNTPRIL